MNRRAVTSTLLVLMVCSSCTSANHQSQSPEPSIGPSGGTLDLGNGVSVSAPAGTMTGLTTMTASSPPPSAALTPPRFIELPEGRHARSPVRMLHLPVQVEASRSFSGPITLSLSVPRSEADTDGFIARFDAQGQRWIPVKTTYDSTNGALEARIRHLSIWGGFGWIKDRMITLASGMFKALFGPALAHGGSPSCAQAPSGISVREVTHANDAVRYCLEATGATAATLKIVNTRAYPIDLVIPSGASYTSSDTGSVFQRIGAAITAAGRSNLQLLAPRAEADVRFPLSSSGQAAFDTQIDAGAYLASVLDVALQTAGAIFGAFGYDSESLVAQAISHLDVAKCFARTSLDLNTSGADFTQALASRLGEIGFQCATAAMGEAGMGVLFSVLASAIGIVVGLVDSLVQGVWGLIDTATGYSFHTIVVGVAGLPPSLLAQFVGPWYAHSAKFLVDSDGMVTYVYRRYDLPGIQSAEVVFRVTRILTLSSTYIEAQAIVESEAKSLDYQAGADYYFELDTAHDIIYVSKGQSIDDSTPRVCGPKAPVGACGA